MTYRLILNPVAGRGRGARARAVIERVLGRAGVPYDLVQTRAAGEATRLARQAVERGDDIIVAVGGDGTTHEVVNGMIQARQEGGHRPASQPIGTLGVIPVGTGNDYCWRLGIPENDPEAACRVLLADRRRTVDLGQVVDDLDQMRVFANHLGGGFEASANIESRRIRHLSGLLLYLVAVLRTIPEYSRGRPTTVRYNGTEQTRRLLLVSVSNGGRSGGGFKVAPAARLDDGLLDLVLADSPHAAIILWLLPHFMLGTHGSQRRYVAMDRTGHVIVESPAGMPVHLDGEIFRQDARRLEIGVLRGCLEIVSAEGRAA